MKTRIIILVLVAFFSFSVSAQTEQKAPLNFNVEKVLVNIDKIASQDLKVMLKGNISEKIDANNFWFKDETGKIQVSLTQEQLAEVGEYSATTIFYIVGKIEDVHNKTFKISDIKKVE